MRRPTRCGCGRRRRDPSASTRLQDDGGFFSQPLTRVDDEGPSPVPRQKVLRPLRGFRMTRVLGASPVILSREDGRRISKYDDRRAVASVVAAEILRRLRAFRMTGDFTASESRRRRPVDSQDAPVSSANALVHPRNALVRSADALVDSGDALVDSGDALVDSPDTLVVSRNALVDSRNALVVISSRRVSAGGQPVSF
jgi:hypothetical protein